MQLHKLQWVGIAGGLVVWSFIDAQKLSQTNTFVVRVENLFFVCAQYSDALSPKYGTDRELTHPLYLCLVLIIFCCCFCYW